MEVKNITIGGADISYAERAGTNTDGPTLLFVHGYLDSWMSWSLVLKSLQYEGRVVSVTLRGWGDSAKSGEFSVAAYSRDIVVFMASVGIRDAVLCGHSMGTLVATSVAATARTRVRGCVLCGAMAKLDPALDIGDGTTLGAIGESLDAWKDGVELGYGAVKFLQEFQLEGLNPFLKSGKVSHSFAIQVMAETLKPKADPTPYKECWSDMLSEDHRKELGDIEAPTCIIWGADDTICPMSKQAELIELLTSAKTCTFHRVLGAGYSLIWTHAEESAALIDSFLESLVK